MIATDSYDSLAASIERRVRTDIAVPPADAPLATAIDRIMHEQACAAEWRIGYLRFAVMAPLLAWGGYEGWRGGATMPAVLAGTAALLTLAWLAAALALMLALRRGWYARWVPRVVPTADAATIVLGFLVAWDVTTTAGGRAALVGYVAVLCAFLALAGALRLSRWSARTSAGLAVAVFLAAAATSRLHPLATVGIGIALGGIGLLGASVTSLIRRVVTDEAARATLERMYKDAEVMIQAREQVLKVVSHDLRNPLHTISMSASLLLEVPLPPEGQATHLQRIKRAGERMNRLIRTCSTWPSWSRGASASTRGSSMPRRSCARRRRCSNPSPPSRGSRSRARSSSPCRSSRPTRDA